MKRILAVLTVAATCLTVMAPAASAVPDWRYEDCRFKTVGGPRWSSFDVSLLIGCVSDQQGIDPAIPRGIYNCETGHPYEYGHSDSVHGPLQYMVGTFHSQQAAMPHVVRRYDLAERVHNVKANLVTGIGWMARNGTSPWSGCD